MSKARRISQREAHRLRRENETLRNRVNLSSVTPYQRIAIAEITLDAIANAKRDGAQRFGARLRWEQYGDKFVLYAYREDEC